MASSAFSERTTVGTASTNLCYELDADRYPTLGNAFFTHLREQYPRVFQRTVPYDAKRSSVKSSSSSDDNKSVWSLWDCDGDEEKAVVKEAGGFLIPRSDLSVHERLKRNCDSFNSVKSTAGDLLMMLRSLRNALLADDKTVVAEHGTAGDIGLSHCSDGSAHGFTDSVSNPSTSNSVSRNTSCETQSSKSSVQSCNETLRITTAQSAGCGMQLQTVVSADVTPNTSNIHYDMPQVQSADFDIDNQDVVYSDLLQEYAKDQLHCASELHHVSRNFASSLQFCQTETDQGLVTLGYKTSNNQF